MKLNTCKNYLNLIFALLFIALTASVVIGQPIRVDMEQCANGPQSAPISCNVSTANDGYTRGSINDAKSHYKEGDSVPVRIVIQNLTIGQSYTVTIAYDFTKNGKYAIDYLTDYDRTESVNNNPCVGVTGCTLASELTFPIPGDAEVANGFDQAPGGGDDISQIPGNFSIFGGMITAVSGYTRTGSQAGDSTKFLTITFTANQEDVVIAYGAHISTRVDWGAGNSAISISGAPYHQFIEDFPGSNEGQRDLSLTATAVIFPAKLVVIKNTVAVQSNYQFPFSLTGLITDNFFLDTDPGTATPTDTYTSVDVTTFGGSSNQITVSEGMLSDFWQLKSRNCVEDANGGAGGSTITPDINGNTVTIGLVEGAIVTCTYVNERLVLTAASATISGRIINSSGRGLKGITVTATALSTGEMSYTSPDSYGNFRFVDLPVGDSYLVTVKSRYFSFEPSSKIVTLNGDFTDLNFTTVPPKKTRGDK